MAFDFKKEFKEFYLPATKPAIVEMPVMNYLAVRGKGNPNAEGGEYKQALEQLYGIAYTLKMSYKSDYRIEVSSSMSYRRWKVCGGLRMARLITPTKMASISFP